MTTERRPTAHHRTPELRTGRFTNGMEYGVWGDGPKDLLWMPGGPGGTVPTGAMYRTMTRLFRPLTDDGYRIWWVLRRTDMPEGHTVADMADDYATVIREDFGGRVDIAAGVSYGGMVGQYLAARHPETFGTVALVAAAWKASEWAIDVDRQLAEATARGDARGVAEAMASYVVPDERLARPRRLLVPAMARMVGRDVAADDDALVEWRAEAAFDSRPVLGEITVPVLLLAGDRDRCFEREVIVETAALIPHSTLVWYRGRGHMRTATDPRVGRDILQFARANERASAA
ncbi:alpha/beta fold hydrolase [Actinotalea sp. Marseille-Q4924]|uniref:alpha/beta fold hydrolase n=1 Tax=Actinotalea sp. Marseille-Q4924 TaxID=2866571 RepID=UPI001CE3F289|nr:alpha/beta fold hydrolase [Actinotalea sp. Marseille-Q4924]